MITERTFNVEDPAAFEKELQQIGVAPDNWNQGLTYTKEPDGSFWVGGYDADLLVQDSECNEIEILPIIQKHMRSDSIGVIKQVGYEKLRDVTGYVMVFSKTQVKSTDLDRMELKLEEQLLLSRKRKFKLLSESVPTTNSKSDPASQLSQSLSPLKASVNLGHNNVKRKS
jgi:hypothetical protein